MKSKPKVLHRQPAGLEPGIYFGLPEERYHADPAVSHSGMVKLLTSPLDYWIHSPLNTSRTFNETDAMTFGKRCHMLLLEPDEFLKKHSCTGMKYTPGKVLINRTEWQNITDSIDMIKSVPDAYNYFKHGYAEVSIVWRDEETGIMCRIRVDWLRTFGGIDYKRAKDIQDNPLGWAIADHGYDIQSKLYKRGIAEIKKLLRGGTVKVFGKVDKEWLKQFISDEDVMFRFVFQRSTAPFVFTILFFDEEIESNAEVRCNHALQIYKKFIEAHGVARWPAGSAKPRQYSIYNLPRKIFDQGTEQYE